jgi:hypothetical protein
VVSMDSKVSVVMSLGYYYGSLWQMLQYGWWRKKDQVRT